MTSLSRFSRPLLLQSILRAVKTKHVSLRDGGGHARTFIIRQGSFETNRIKDTFHFYVVGIGFLPITLLGIGVYIVCGPCELTDWPEDGIAPRCWQFERTPLRQGWIKMFEHYGSPFPGISLPPFHTHDERYHETKLSMFMWKVWRMRIRQQIERVKHLMNERQDYKGWQYVPMDIQWLEIAKMRADSDRLNQETWRRIKM